MSCSLPGGINVWTVAEDEVWLVAYAPAPGGPPLKAVDFGPIAAGVAKAGAAVVDLSSGWAILRLAGPRSRESPRAPPRTRSR